MNSFLHNSLANERHAELIRESERRRQLMAFRRQARAERLNRRADELRRRAEALVERTHQ